MFSLQYTDGLSEAMNPERNTAMTAWEFSAEKLSGGSAAQILEGTATAVEEFTGTSLRADGPSELSDHIALVCLKRGIMVSRIYNAEKMAARAGGLADN